MNKVPMANFIKRSTPKGFVRFSKSQPGLISKPHIGISRNKHPIIINTTPAVFGFAIIFHFFLKYLRVIIMILDIIFNSFFVFWKIFFEC